MRRTTISLPDPLAARLESEANRRRTSVSEVVRDALSDYLGLTIETVSRTFTLLENTAAIEVSTSRRIVLRNRSALNRLAA